MPEGASRDHHLYQFRGVRRSLDDTLVVLLIALCNPRPDPEAWLLLEALAREQYGNRAGTFLSSSISQAVARLDNGVRDTTLAALADVIAAGDGAQLLPHLAADADVTSRLLALNLVVRLPIPVDESHLTALQPLLLDRRLPAETLVAAAAALVRTTGKDGRAARELYEALVRGLGKSRSIERLRELEQHIGSSATLDALCAQFEEQLRMSCPRCAVQLRRRDMINHLWEEHTLLLDGRRVREPWQLIEDWIDDFRRQPDPDVLARCRLLGQRLDPENGLLRVQRLFLARGIEDADARKTLLAEAEQRRASLCPHCYAFVPVPHEVPQRPLNVWHGRLSLHGYRVEVRDGGLFTRLEIVTPNSRLYDGPEPEHRLTRKGALILFTGPFVLASLLLACGIIGPNLPPLLPVVLLLTAALVVTVGIHLHWQTPAPATDRAVDRAWTDLVPRLHAQGFAESDSAFLAGLALTSLEQGTPEVRERPLQRVLSTTEKAVAAGYGIAEHLADLHRLAITDAAAAGADPVELVAVQVGRCFEGNLPLVVAERLLSDWESGWWTPINMQRLRILLCDRAFEAGFEVSNLVEAGRVTPALGTVLGTDDRPALARLRLLWSWRPRRPWDVCGEAATVFEVAADAKASAYLAKYADLLLVQELTLPNDEREEATILVCGRGVVFETLLFQETPRTIEVVTRRNEGRRGYELIVGSERFWFHTNPDVLAGRLERWFRFFFNEFAPQVASVRSWQSPGVAATLRAKETVPCPECHRAVHTRAGKVGVSLDEGA